MRSDIWRLFCSCWVWRVRRRDARWRASRWLVKVSVREFGEVIDVEDNGFMLVSCLSLLIGMS